MSRFTRTSFIAAVAIATAAPLSAVLAQASPPPPPPPKPAMTTHEMHHMGTGWKELDAFHSLMELAWHPAKDSTNLGPAREHALKLAEAAKSWSATKAPASCDTKPVRDAVSAVAADSRAFSELVAMQAADSTLKRALSALHDTFEVANKACSTMKH